MKCCVMKCHLNDITQMSEELAGQDLGSKTKTKI